ncbi:MAG: hypothetical protein WAK16_08790 [Candidatus Cybelea sp.]
MAVAQELASRYCPHGNAVFLMRSGAFFAVFIAGALALLLGARRGTKRPSDRTPLYIVAGALLLFAIGSGALVLYGLSGCSGVPAEGLIWDWP